MTDVNTIQGNDILTIPENEPERLFSGVRDTLKAEYRKLARRFHPDVSFEPKANDVLQHVNVLYRVAQEKLDRGTWQTPGLLDLKDIHGQRYRMRFRKHAGDDLGDVYIGRTHVVYATDRQNADLLDTAQTRIRDLRFADEAMRREMMRFLPAVAKRVTTTDRDFLVLENRRDTVRVADLIEYLGGQVPPRHVAWIVNAALNVACYLEWAGVTHNAILPETFFVGPHDHAGALTGGWFYAVGTGKRLNALPKAAHQVAPRDIVQNKVGDPRLDLELIRRLGRACFGDAGGSRMATNPDIPEPMKRWLRHPTTGSALRDYELWQTAVDESFGPRRFVDLNVRTADIYPEQT